MAARGPVAQGWRAPAVEAGEPGRPAVRDNPLNYLLSAIYRQRMPLMLSVAGALLLGLLAILLLPKTYTATASVQLEQQTAQVIPAPGLDPEQTDANRFLQTQLDFVESRSLAREVAQKVGIERFPRILAALDVETPRQQEIDLALIEGVMAELGLNTRVAKISFVSRDPEVSALIANAYAAALIEANLQGKVETSDRAQSYLLQQLEDAKRKLEQSEREMLGYARAANLTGTTSADEAMTGSMPGRQIDELAASLAAATARRIDAQQEWSQVSGAPATSLPQVQENRAYQELLARKAQLQADLAQDRQRHTDEYPTVAATRVQVDELDREIARLAASIKNSYYQRYQSAARQEAQMQATIDRLRREAMDEQQRGVGYNSLRREVETNRIAYDGLLQRYKEVSAASGAPAANVTLIDRAEIPLEPSSARPAWILALALIGGLIVGMAIALAREATASVIRSLDDLRDELDLPALGVIPLLDRGTDIADALRNPHSPQAEAFKSVAAALRQPGTGQPPKTLLVTSTQANEGKSTSTWGLARGLSALGHRVLVINGDLRNPRDVPGLADALAGTADPQSLVRTNHRLKFDVIDSGKVEGDIATLLAPERLKRVLDELSGMADIILVDGPPVMGLVDAVLMASAVDAVLMVVEANRIRPVQLDTAVSRLPETVPVAAILTKFDARLSGAWYGSTQYYSYGRHSWEPQPT